VRVCPANVIQPAWFEGGLEGFWSPVLNFRFGHCQLHCTACGHVHYRNAKPCAGALVARDGRLLLVKRAIQPFLGYWDIPGGFLEEDEHPETGAIREALEETGLKVRLTDLFGFYVDRYGDEGDYCLNIYFLAEVVGGQERPADDAAELAWFAPNELPEQIAFDHAREVLDDWAQWMEKKQKDQ
jgi:ADP-ribose pyrophosphatase YjhB (NUDIX family)